MRDEAGNIIYQTQQVPVYRTDYSAAQGTVTETYTYDGLNRMTGVARDGVTLDTRYYDGANRVLLTGPSGSLPVGYVNALNNGVAGASGSETRINRYDANGRLLHQKVLKSDNSAKYDVDYGSYDAAGNLLGYSVQNYEGTAYTNTYSISQKRFEGYKEGSVYGTSSVFQAGSTTDYYDANGLLVAVTDSTAPANNKSFVNDAAGRALYASQNGYAQRQLIVNGDVLGRYGEQASGAGIADFNFGYQPINGSYPLASPGVYIVSPGDTLQSIARSAYGDSTLWYRIAEANGLNGDNDLKVGQSLSIPNRVGSLSNNAKTFKPYDPSQIRGDTTPNLPAPEPVANNADGGCGGLGQVLVLVVVIVVTVYTVGAMSGLVAPGAGFGATMSAGAATIGTAGAGTLAVAGAAGSIAGQFAGNLLGIQDGFNWEQVALSGLSAGMMSGVGEFLPDIGGAAGTLGNVMAKAAIGNALTQGVGVVLGLQDKFDWRGVVASALGAGVGHEVGGALGMHDPGFKDLSFGEQFGSRLVTGLAAGTATAVARGGRIAVQQIATDAFGNALGQSLADALGPQNTPQEKFRLEEINQQNAQARADAAWTGSGLKLGANTASGWGPNPYIPDVLLPADYGLPVAGVRLPTTIGTIDQGSTIAGDVDAGAPRPGMTLTSEGWRDMNALAPVGGNGGLLADNSRLQKVATPTKSIAATYNDLAVQNYNDAKLLYNLSTGLQKTNPEFSKTYRSMADGYMAAGDTARSSAQGFYVYSEPMWKNAPTQTTSFAPGWNTGEYSAGTPYAGGNNKPDYASFQLGLYVAAGGVSINLHNGDIYGQWSMNRAYPSYSIAPGLSIVTGKIIGGEGASDTNEFLGGGSAQGSAFFPSPIPLIGVGGGLNHSYGGKTAIEIGLSFPPGVGVSPAGYGFELKSSKPK